MKMLAPREAAGVVLSGHTAAQKLNYLKFLASKKGEILNYDPVTISIVATTRCTLSCDMCPTHSAIVPRDYPYTQKNTKDMTFDMFKDIIDRFRNAATVHIIGSGEPILNNDFFRMADYAAARRMVVKTFSNGTVVEDNIEKIIDSKLDGITISINGHDAKEFKRMTGMGEEVYGRIYEAAKRLIEEKMRRKAAVKVKLSFILDKTNYRFIHEMIGVSIGLGADHTFFCNFLPAPYDGFAAPERVLMAEDAVIDELRGALQRYPPEIRKTFTPPVLVNPGSGENNCNTHFSQIRFDGDGNVSSCSMMLLDMTGHGSYRDKDVWNNDFFRKMRRVFLSHGNELVPDPCKVCPDNRGVKI